MNINPINSAANQPIKQTKGHDKVKSDNDAPKANAAVKNDDRVKMNFGHNQKLIIGAKTLLASLNKELKLNGVNSFEAFSNKSLSIKGNQSVALDKIEIKPFEFDFEAVAKNVMDFVSGVIMGAQAGGASDEKLNEMLAQARSGIDQGFSQAREELKGFDIYTKDIEEGINKSYDLIQNSMADLESQLFSTEAADKTTLVSSSQQVDLVERESGSITIKTLDGDNVSINFGTTTSLSQRQQLVDGALTSTIEFDQSKSLSFVVDGELEQAETKAISSLVKDISKLADDFFAGDFEKAWQQAADLGFDDQQIAQFAFDFKEVKQVSILEHYTQGSNDSPIKTLAPYIKDVNAVAKLAESLFDANNLKQLMHDVAGQKIDLNQGINSLTAENFNDFNQRVLTA